MVGCDWLDQQELSGGCGGCRREVARGWNKGGPQQWVVVMDDCWESGSRNGEADGFSGMDRCGSEKSQPGGPEERQEAGKGSVGGMTMRAEGAVSLHISCHTVERSRNAAGDGDQATPCKPSPPGPPTGPSLPPATISSALRPCTGNLIAP